MHSLQQYISNTHTHANTREEPQKKSSNRSGTTVCEQRMKIRKFPKYSDAAGAKASARAPAHKYVYRKKG